MFKVSNVTTTTWTTKEEVGFRFAFIFFLVLSIPLDYKFYSYLFSGEWLDFHITHLLRLASYLPQFFSENGEHFTGLFSFSSWFLAIGAAAIGTILWTVYELKNPLKKVDYDQWYYWLRVILRYRLGIAMVAYGFIKLFPLQMPFPSLSNLHTNYGDFLPWKIYFHTLGIAPNYESFFGFVEILAGLLIFSRNKVTFGTGILLGFAGNIVAANFAYRIGSEVLSTYLNLVAAFLFAYDIPRLYNLLALAKPTKAERFEPDFSSDKVRNVRKGLKIATYVFVGIIGISAYLNFTSDPYLIPHKKGLAGAFGYYNVKHFVLNKDTLPYSKTNPERWQNVIFEEWSTISIKTAKPIEVDHSLVHADLLPDVARVYESAGTGDRRYFDYAIDAASHAISLENKNIRHQNEKYKLTYTRPDKKTIILHGVNEKNDSITAVLEKIERKYMVIEGRRKPVKL